MTVAYLIGSVIYVFAVLSIARICYRRGMRAQLQRQVTLSLCTCGHPFNTHTGTACKTIVRRGTTGYTHWSESCSCTVFVGSPPVNALARDDFLLAQGIQPEPKQVEPQVSRKKGVQRYLDSL